MEGRKEFKGKNMVLYKSKFLVLLERKYILEMWVSIV